MRSPSVKQFRAFLKRELRMAEEALASQPDRDPKFWTYNGMVGAGFYRRYLVWLDAHKMFDDMLTREDRRWLKFIKVKA